jgi:hypothetical protein
MYLVSVNETSADIAAATAAHRELGRDYEDAIAEGLVERIGSEIDRRVDARLQQEARGRRAVSQPAPSARAAAFFALGSMGAGIGAASVILSLGSRLASQSQIALVTLIWVMIAIINIAYSRKR